MTYDDYRVVPIGAQGVAVPYEVFFEHPGRGTDLRLRFEEIALNVRVPEGAFAQTPAPGLAVREARCDEDFVPPGAADVAAEDAADGGAQGARAGQKSGESGASGGP